MIWQTAIETASPWLKRAKQYSIGALLTYLALIPAGALATEHLEKIAIQLKWRHQFQFAGYYAAQRQGYFTAEGLDVDLLEGAIQRNPVTEVIAGRATYGISDSDLLTAHAQGLPVVVIAAIFQYSPYILLTREADGLRQPKDFVGRRIMTGSGHGEVQARALFIHEEIDPATIQFIHQSWSVMDLVEGRVDALLAYETAEPYLLQALGTPTGIIRPRDYGIDFYGDCLFTSAAEVRDHPERVEAVRRAVLKGWNYALQHPAEVSEWILAMPGVLERGIGADHLAFEAAAMKPLVLADIIPLGHINRDRWQHILETYQQLGIVPSSVTLDGFLFEPDLDLSQRIIQKLALGAAIFSGGLLLLFLWNFALRRQVRKSTRAIRQAAIVFENTHEGVIITDANEQILRVNRAFCEITGYAESEMRGQTPRLFQSDRQNPKFYAAMWASIRDADHWQGEIWNRRKNDEIYPALISISAVRNETGAVTQYVGILADLSAIKDSEAQLDFLAHYDPLTRLPNRRLLSTRLQHSLAAAHREGGSLALLMLDLDRFKDVNDSYGHPAGDELLQQVAARLTGRLRGIDTVARLGGDEFAVLLENLAHPQDAARIAVEIIAILGEPWRLTNGADVRLGASVGISLFPAHGLTAEDLLQQVDAALYQAKTEGRGRFQYFSADLTQSARQRLELEARLRRALAEQQFRVYYQPQIDITSERIIGAEALVRWQDPEHGLIPPGHFIPVAEETGLISAISEWVLRETCRQGREWLDAGLAPLTLAVNLSAHQLHHGDIAATVLQALRDTGYPAAWLELELTESALMQRETEAVMILERLRGLGLRLAMDDFGTGYSSLAYLKRFPLDVLKIDKSFVDDIPQHRDDMEIAATIIAMGHNLGLKVLAEGVETSAQLAFLKLKGCDLYQGYLTSPPIPAEAFAALRTSRG